MQFDDCKAQVLADAIYTDTIRVNRTLPVFRSDGLNVDRMGYRRVEVNEQPDLAG